MERDAPKPTREELALAVVKLRLTHMQAVAELKDLKATSGKKEARQAQASGELALFISRHAASPADAPLSRCTDAAMALGEAAAAHAEALAAVAIAQGHAEKAEKAAMAAVSALTDDFVRRG